MLRFVKPIIKALVEWGKPEWFPVDLIVPEKQLGQSSDYGVDFGPSCNYVSCDIDEDVC